MVWLLFSRRINQSIRTTPSTLFDNVDLLDANDAKVLREIRLAIGHISTRQDFVAQVDGAFEALQYLNG